MTVGPESFDRPLHPALVVEPSLAGPDVEVHAEVLEGGFDAGAYTSGGPAAHDVGTVRAGSGRGSEHVVRQPRCQVLHVRALVALVGYRLPELHGEDRGTEMADLGTGIVEVVLARHGLATGRQDATQQVPDERPAGVADRQWSGRVGRHELDIHGACTDRGDTAPVGRHCVDPIDDRGVGITAQSEIQEPGRGDLGRLDRRGNPGLARLAGEVCGQDGRDRHGRHPVWPCELHREVGREITVVRVGRSLHLDRRTDLVVDRRQVAGPHGRVPGTLDGGASLRSEGWLDHGRSTSAT